MNEFDVLLRYLQLAPLQLALIRAKEVFWMSQIKIPKPILDIGCADGIFGEVLFRGKKNAINTGVDIDRQALNLAKNRMVYKKVLQVDVRSLPFKNKSFATVISNQSLEHIENIDLVLQEINRVLKPDGKLVFLVPTVFLDDYWLTSTLFKSLGFKKLSILIHNWRNKIFQHVNLLPWQVWQKKLQKAGFKLESYQYIGTHTQYFISELFWPLRLPQFLATRLLKRPILFPRWPAFLMVKLLGKYIDHENTGRAQKGPTLLIIAGKLS